MSDIQDVYDLTNKATQVVKAAYALTATGNPDLQQPLADAINALAALGTGGASDEAVEALQTAVGDLQTAMDGKAAATDLSATNAAVTKNTADIASNASGISAVTQTVTNTVGPAGTLTLSDAATRVALPLMPNGKAKASRGNGYYGFQNGGPTKTGTYRAANAFAQSQLGYRNMTIAVVGDSNKSGHGAGLNQTVETTGYQSARNRNFQAHLAMLLNNGKPVGEMLAGNENLTVAQWAFPFDSRVSIGAGWVPSTGINPSLGGMLWSHLSTNTSVAPITFTPLIPYNQVDIWTVANGAGLSDLTVTQGSNTLGTVSETATTPAYTKTQFATTLGLGALGVAPATATKQAYLGQIVTRDTTRVGIEIYEHAFDGGRAVANYNFNSQVWEHLAAMKAMAPDLVILQLGINDINQAATADAWIAAMQALITSYRQTSDVIVEFFFPIVVGAVGGTNNTLVRNAQFQTALYNLADTMNFPIINHTDRFGGVSNWSPLSLAGLTFDNNHMSSAGYGQQAVAAAHAIKTML